MEVPLPVVPRPAVVVPPPVVPVAAAPPQRDQTSTKKRAFNERDEINDDDSASADQPKLKRAKTDEELGDSGPVQDEELDPSIPVPGLSFLDPDHPLFGSVVNAFEYVVWYLSPKDCANLARQSHALRDCVVLFGTVCFKQLAYTMSTPPLAYSALPLFDRFLRQPWTTTTDVFALVVTAVLHNANVDVAQHVLSRITEAPIPRSAQTRSTFKALARHALDATAWTEVCDIGDELPGTDPTWLEVYDIDDGGEIPRAEEDTEFSFQPGREAMWQTTQVFSDMENYPCEIVKSAFKEILVDMQADTASATLSGFSSNLCHVLGSTPVHKNGPSPVAHTRISGVLLKTLVSSGIVTPFVWMAENQDTFISSIVRNIARLEADGVKDTRPELEAIDFIVATCAFSNSNELPETACELASTKINANLLQKLRPNVGNWSLKNSSKASPLRIAIVKNNVDALCWIARLAVAQNASATTQKRAVELAMTRKAFPCLRILVEEGFMVTSSLLKNTVIENKDAWGTADRKKAFDAIFTNIEVTAARTRTGIEPLVKYLTTALNLKFESTHVSCEAWPATVAGDFLSALWSSTDGRKSAVRAKIASTPDFRKLVDYTLVGHIQLILYGMLLMEQQPPDQDRAKMALLDRISELFDIQKRCTSAYQPSAERTSNSAETFDPTGVSFDMWLVNHMLPSIAMLDWKTVQELATMIPEIAACVVTTVVHTDEMFHSIATRGFLKEAGSPALLREILLSAAKLDPDDQGDGEEILLLRRVLRWAGVFKADERFRNTDYTRKHVAVLESLASIESDTESGDVVQRLDHIINTIQAQFAQHDPPTPIGGVQRLYTEYDGDVNAALTDLYEKRENKRPMIEPTGDLREILIYAMASSKHIELDQRTVLETVVKYSACVTLPCVTNLTWVVTNSNLSKTAPTPWIRDVLRGTRSHVRWWVPS
jgi:hypothetical protein